MHLDKAIQHPLAPSLIEFDGQLVAVNRLDHAVAEFLMEHPLTR